MNEMQRQLRRFLRAEMSEQARSQVCIELPEGVTNWEALLLVAEHAGMDTSGYPRELPDE